MGVVLLGGGLVIYSSIKMTDVKNQINEQYKGYSLKKANKKIKEIDQKIMRIKNLSQNNYYKNKTLAEKYSTFNKQIPKLKNEIYEGKRGTKKADNKIKNYSKKLWSLKDLLKMKLKFKKKRFKSVFL